MGKRAQEGVCLRVSQPNMEGLLQMACNYWCACVRVRVAVAVLCVRVCSERFLAQFDTTVAYVRITIFTSSLTKSYIHVCLSFSPV